MQYVSILSPAFSGSTLLSMILCGQSRTIGFGDTYFGPGNNPENICNCGVPFTECRPRKIVESAVRAGGQSDFSWLNVRPVPMPASWPVELQRYWPLWRAASIPFLRVLTPNLRSSIFQKFYTQTNLMIEGLGATGDYDFYVDGSKFPVRLELLRTEIPNLKVIHMIRHPGAILYRYQKLGINQQKAGLAKWRRYHERAHQFKSLVMTDHYLVVSSESIVRNLGEFLKQVRHFIGMPAELDSDPRKLHRDQVHIIGNRMRKNADHIMDMADSWKQHLAAPARLLAENAVLGVDWMADLIPDK